MTSDKRALEIFEVVVPPEVKVQRDEAGEIVYYHWPHEERTVHVDATQAQHVADDRRMVYTRSFLQGAANDLRNLMIECQRQHLGELADEVSDIQATLLKAFEEVQAMEAGCGATEPGECLCPCHLL